MRKCFVISPIGKEGSEIRQHADFVFYFIIKPALEKFGIKATRSDHIQKPGRITEQMFEEIFKSDLCIAVASFKNPNVFYEIAAAQFVNKPLIILMRHDEELPFDLKDLRCIFYDLDPEKLIKHYYTNKIIEQIKSLEETNWKSKWSIPGFSRINDPRIEYTLKPFHNIEKRLQLLFSEADCVWLLSRTGRGWYRDFENQIKRSFEKSMREGKENENLIEDKKEIEEDLKNRFLLLDPISNAFEVDTKYYFKPAEWDQGSLKQRKEQTIGFMNSLIDKIESGLKLSLRVYDIIIPWVIIIFNPKSTSNGEKSTIIVEIPTCHMGYKNQRYLEINQNEPEYFFGFKSLFEQIWHNAKDWSKMSP